MILAEQRSIIEQLKDEQDFSDNGARMRGLNRTVSDQAYIQGGLAKKRYPGKPFTIIIVVVLCLAVANLIFQALLIKRTEEINVWQSKLAKLERRSIKLRIEMADLESFERIQTAAQKDLGMKVAGPDDYLCIAAVPEHQTEQPRTYGTYTTKTIPQNNLWTKLANWLEGIEETMAQTP
jgi:cell division protein FtsL